MMREGDGGGQLGRKYLEFLFHFEKKRERRKKNKLCDIYFNFLYKILRQKKKKKKKKKKKTHTGGAWAPARSPGPSRRQGGRAADGHGDFGDRGGRRARDGAAPHLRAGGDAFVTKLCSLFFFFFFFFSFFFFFLFRQSVEWSPHSESLTLMSWRQV
jgi:hypothetical protein